MMIQHDVLLRKKEKFSLQKSFFPDAAPPRPSGAVVTME